MQQPRLPKYTARFAVLIPVAATTDAKRAKEIVARYCYAGAEVEHIELTKEAEGFLVHVRIDTREDAERFKFVVNYQRDRFASGMYATSEPIFYGPTNL